MNKIITILVILMLLIFVPYWIGKLTGFDLLVDERVRTMLTWVTGWSVIVVIIMVVVFVKLMYELITD